MTTTAVNERPTEPRLHTIGAVCERCHDFGLQRAVINLLFTKHTLEGFQHS